MEILAFLIMYITAAVQSFKNLINNIMERNYQAVAMFGLALVVSVAIVFYLKITNIKELQVDFIINSNVFDLIFIGLVVGLFTTGAFDGVKATSSSIVQAVNKPAETVVINSDDVNDNFELESYDDIEDDVEPIDNIDGTEVIDIDDSNLKRELGVEQSG